MTTPNAIHLETEALRDVVALAQQATEARTYYDEQTDESYLFQPGAERFERLEPVDRANRFGGAAVLTIDSLIEWCRGAQMSHGAGIIELSRTGTSYARTPGATPKHVTPSKCSMPFFGDFLPGAAPGKTVEWSYERVMEWLAQLGDYLDPGERQLLELALSQVDIVEEGKFSISKKGGLMTVRFTQGGSVRGTEGDLTVPEYLHARIPFGDPGFLVDVTFGFEIRQVGSSVVYVVRHIIADGAVDRWLEWAQAKVRAEVEAGLEDPDFGLPAWTVLTTR